MQIEKPRLQGGKEGGTANTCENLVRPTTSPCVLCFRAFRVWGFGGVKVLLIYFIRSLDGHHSAGHRQALFDMAVGGEAGGGRVGGASAGDLHGDPRGVALRRRWRCRVGCAAGLTVRAHPPLARPHVQLLQVHNLVNARPRQVRDKHKDSAAKRYVGLHQAVQAPAFRAGGGV